MARQEQLELVSALRIGYCKHTFVMLREVTHDRTQGR